MKKIISILLASFLLAFSANAEGMIGIKLGGGSLDGERTQDASHGTANASASVDHEYAAIFLENAVNDVVSIGLELVPLEGQISTKDTTASDTTVFVSNLKTIYGLFPIGDSPVYAKVGYSHADLDVDSNYDQNTVNSFDDAAMGPMIGIGAQFDSPIPYLDVLRVEGTYTRFNELSITTTDTGHAAITRKGEAELTTLSVSIARSF